MVDQSFVLNGDASSDRSVVLNGDASSDHSVVLNGDASSQEWRRWKEEKMLEGQTRTNAVTKDCRSTYKYLILGVPLNAHFNTLEHFHQALGGPRTSQDFPRTSQGLPRTS